MTDDRKPFDPLFLKGGTLGLISGIQVKFSDLVPADAVLMVSGGESKLLRIVEYEKRIAALQEYEEELRKEIARKDERFINTCKVHDRECDRYIRERDNARQEIERLRSLAVCSSGEGTNSYYKDLYEARGKEIERLRSCLHRAGCIAFMRQGTSEEVAAHLKSVMKSYTSEIERSLGLLEVARRALNVICDGYYGPEPDQMAHKRRYRRRLGRARHIAQEALKKIGEKP